MASRHRGKRTSIFSFNTGFLSLFLLLLIAEVGALALAGDNIIRAYVGDVLVIPLMYCFLATFWRCPRFLPFLLLLFAFAVEVGQLFHVFGPPDDYTFIQFIFGGTFDPIDLLCYMIGALSIDVTWSIYKKRRAREHRRASQNRYISGR